MQGALPYREFPIGRGCYSAGCFSLSGYLRLDVSEENVFTIDNDTHSTLSNANC